jgi:hypothetical protein
MLSPLPHRFAKPGTAAGFVSLLTLTLFLLLREGFETLGIFGVGQTKVELGKQGRRRRRGRDRGQSVHERGRGKEEK